MADHVHVFVSVGRFSSRDELRAFIDETYGEDGDGVPSDFMREVGLSDYEPGCIEAIVSETGEPVGLAQLLRRTSYADSWLPRVDAARSADAAVCVFPPNVVSTPSASSLDYLGAFPFERSG